METMAVSPGYIDAADNPADAAERPSAEKSYRAEAPTGAQTVSDDSPKATKKETLSRAIESHQIQSPAL